MFIKNSITDIAHYNAFHFLKYVHFSYAKCSFGNIHKQQVPLKSSLFKKKYNIYEGITWEFLGLTSQNNKDIIWRDFQICISVPLSNPRLQVVNRFLVSNFSDRTGKTGRRNYFFRNAHKEDYNVIIDEQNFFDQGVNSNMRTSDNVQKIVVGQGDDYTINCLLDYP